MLSYEIADTTTLDTADGGTGPAEREASLPSGQSSGNLLSSVRKLSLILLNRNKLSCIGSTVHKKDGF